MRGHVSFESDKEKFERFLAIISRADHKKGLDAAMIVCASMLLAVQSFLVAAFGRQEAQAIIQQFVDGVFERTRPQ